MTLFASTNYPTPEEIMDHPISFRLSTIDIVTDWRAAHFGSWPSLEKSTRVDALSALARKLLQSYGVEVFTVQNGDAYSYRPDSRTLTIDRENPSIISTLHEVAHAIYGASELQACRWSVWLFKKVFPKAFDNLTFAPGSHLLVRKPPCSATPASPTTPTSSSAESIKATASESS